MLLAYGFQLYFSFCGWTHIMIGAARLFGLQLHENFNRPYLSTTISVFWTRWHMSLSFWIRDFLFLPLATIRRQVWWRNLSLVIAMFVFGVWHITPAQKGNVLLLLWGTYHGVLLVLHRQWQELRKRLGFEWSGSLQTAISWLFTFNAVLVGYIFFRAESLHQAFSMLKALASFRGYLHPTLDRSFCVMTLAAAVGYFAVLAGDALLDRISEAASRAIRDRAETASSNFAGTSVNFATLPARFLNAFARERWVWIAPIVLVLALYLSVIFHPGHTDTGPAMYALF
jgi:hypothetical protein